MTRLNGKAFVLWILAAVLCVTACGPAYASAGERVLVRVSEADDAEITWIENVCRMDDGFCVICQGSETSILRYTDLQGEPETFVFQPDGSEEYIPSGKPETEPAEEPGEEDDEEEDDGFLLTAESRSTEEHIGSEPEEPYGDIAIGDARGWFSLNNKLYVLQTVELSGEDWIKVKSIRIMHVRLEDGTAILEESGLPELDPEYAVQTAENYEFFCGLDKMFTAGDRLIGLDTGGMRPRLLMFDLTDGSCRVADLYNSTDLAAGPDGSVLINRCNAGLGGIDAEICRLDPESGKEELLAEIKGAGSYEISPCYDPEKDILYYVDKGELWKMQPSEPDKAEALNECQASGSNAMLLADGTILLWSGQSVTLPGTDTAQRDAITLRICDSTYNSAVNEAVFAMENGRDDISVVLQSKGNAGSDLLKAMMTRDAYTDVYILPYDASDFRALRRRQYLADLGGNREIAEATGRLYPFVRDAVKQDGKIIAVPVGLTGDGISINLHAWEKLGRTEAELPGTWDQFLDWLDMLPESLKGTDVTVAGTTADRQGFRAVLIGYLVEMYQIRMEKEGGDYSFNTPMLRGLLRRIADLDYEALCPETVSETATEVKESLLDVDGFKGITGAGRNVPLALAFEEGETPIIPVSLFAAFVNPYSEHQEEAKEFLALVLKKLNHAGEYSLFADRTEPVRSQFATDPENTVETIGKIRTMLETAEGEDRELLEEALRREERTLEDIERSLWVISAEDIGQYRKSQEHFAILDSYFIRDLVGTGEDREAVEAFMLLFYGDENGEINPEKALEIIDKQLRMKRLEGN